MNDISGNNTLNSLSFQPSQTSISALFGGFGTLSVPDFQRDYAWGDVAVSLFLSDVERCRHKRQTSKPQPHFFGAVVTSPADLPGTSRPHLVVIDGQQRLATAFLFLTTLRRRYEQAAATARDTGDVAELAEYFGARADNLVSGFEYSNDLEFKSQKSIRKLLLNKADDPFFAKLLSGQERTAERASHMRLEQAHLAIEKYFDDLIARAEDDEDTKTILDSLYVVFLKDWVVIQLAAGTDKEANRIYRVLNSRGVPVTNCDLLRASTLEFASKKLAPADMEAMALAWDQILKGDELSPDVALQAAFTSRCGVVCQNGGEIEEIEAELFPALLSDTKPTADEAREVKRAVNQLQSDIHELSKISAGEICLADDDRFTPVFKSRFSALTKLLKQSYCFPFLHAAAVLPPQTYVKACDLVERFAFRYGVVVRGPIHAVEPVFREHIQVLRTNPQNFRLADLRRDFARVSEAFANDDLFKERLIAMEYGRDNRKPLKYALIMIEHMNRWFNDNPQGTPVCRDLNHVIDFHSSTLEHIEASNSATLDPELAPFINSIGNLTILSPAENEGLGNRDFAGKKPVFAASGLAINRSIAEFEEWNLENFKARQKDVLDRCLKIFSVS